MDIRSLLFRIIIIIKVNLIISVFHKQVQSRNIVSIVGYLDGLFYQTLNVICKLHTNHCVGLN